MSRIEVCIGSLITGALIAVLALAGCNSEKAEAPEKEKDSRFVYVYSQYHPDAWVIRDTSTGVEYLMTNHGITRLDNAK